MTEPNRGRFVGKVAMVTGGSTGIGLAAAKAFASEGARVVIAARRPEPGHAAVEAIRAGGGEAHFIATDMADPEAIKTMVAQTVRKYGGLDVAYNNAGISGDTTVPIFDASEAEFDEVMATNVRGVWYSTKYAFRAMMERGGGSIVLCGSSASIRGGAGRASAYYTSKHAVMGLMKQVAMDGAPRNIRCNAVLPGLVMTDIITRSFANDLSKLEMYKSRIPLQRPGTVEEIANAVLFLASAEASYITGAALSVDGGSTV
jgi:NAD(P)-dependent dehydrogenase (short-subunit alcohol dehydrogenase family)